MPIYGINFCNKKRKREGQDKESMLIGLTSCLQHSNKVMVLEMTDNEI